MIRRGFRTPNKVNPHYGFALMEVLAAFFIVSMMLLPIYTFITRSVVDTERACAEAFAISHLKSVMDILMFQVPLRCIQSGNPCTLSDSSGKYNELLNITTRKMFGDGFKVENKSHEYRGVGLIKDNSRGFVYYVQVKSIDLSDVPLKIDNKLFLPSQLTSANNGGKCVLMKKLIVEIRWSTIKKEDPLLCSNPRKLFLVAIKSDLES